MPTICPIQAATIPYKACNNTIDAINPILSSNKDNSGITYFCLHLELPYTLLLLVKKTLLAMLFLTE